MKVGTIAPQKYFNNVATLDDKQFFQKVVIKDFDTIGTLAFGQMKFICGQEQYSYYWDSLDAFLNFTEENKLEAYYNTVINNKYSFPDWYMALSQQEKRHAIETHVKNVIERYGERFKVYKLVNEVVQDENENLFGTGLSKIQLTSNIFKWAKEADPKTRCMINDFAIFVRPDIRDAYIELINAVQENGLDIDIIGLQSHLGHPSPNKTPVFQVPSTEILHETLDSLHEKTTLPIHITEFDLSYDNAPLKPYEGSAIDPDKNFTFADHKIYSTWWEYQAYAYKQFFDICASKKFVENITFWGLLDADTLPNERPGVGFYDVNHEPKQNYFTLFS